MTKVQRYKVGYYTDGRGMLIVPPRLIPDDRGFAIRLEDYCKLEAENERLNHNLTSTEQTMREYQELAAKRLEEIAKYRDAPVVCWMVSGSSGMIAFQHHKPDQKDWYSIEPLIVKPGEEK